MRDTIMAFLIAGAALFAGAIGISIFGAWNMIHNNRKETPCHKKHQ